MEEHRHTSEEELLGRVEESMLRLRVGDWVEPAHAHHLADGLATAVVGI
jgi:hypothetical protein